MRMCLMYFVSCGGVISGMTWSMYSSMRWFSGVTSILTGSL